MSGKDVEALIELGVDVNSKDVWGNTALHMAAKDDDLERVEALLKSGADINAKNNQGMTALHLVSNRPPNGPTQRENQKVTALLLQEGADLSAKNREGYTALHCTAECKNIPLAELLLISGADTNVRATLYNLKPIDLGKGVFGSREGTIAQASRSLLEKLEKAKGLVSKAAESSGKMDKIRFYTLALEAKINHIPAVVGMVELLLIDSYEAEDIALAIETIENARNIIFFTEEEKNEYTTCVTKLANKLIAAGKNGKAQELCEIVEKNAKNFRISTEKETVPKVSGGFNTIKQYRKRNKAEGTEGGETFELNLNRKTKAVSEIEGIAAIKAYASKATAPLVGEEESKPPIIEGPSKDNEPYVSENVPQPIANATGEFPPPYGAPYNQEPRALRTNETVKPRLNGGFVTPSQAGDSLGNHQEYPQQSGATAQQLLDLAALAGVPAADLQSGDAGITATFAVTRSESPGRKRGGEPTAYPPS